MGSNSKKQSMSPGALPQRQRGMTMIVALIMLLLLTMIGVAGMRDNQLQEKMAGGAEDRNTAFQAAEAALREGEAQIASGTYSGSCAVGTTMGSSCYVDYSTLNLAPSRLCSGNACTESDYWAQYAWTTNNLSTVYSGSGAAQATTQPRYVIERMPPSFSPVSGTYNATGTTGKPTIADFLITARGTGRTSDAVVILQSVYRTCSGTGC